MLVAKTLKWAKSMVQWHCNKWFETAESFIF